VSFVLLRITQSSDWLAPRTLGLLQAISF